MRALILRGDPTSPSVSIETLTDDEWPAGPVRVAVRYSSLNYKDGLAVTGRGRIIRGAFPFVPGIDLAGEVIDSADDRFRPGDRVVGTGGGLGETRWGGFAGVAAPDPEYLVHLPDALSFHDAMAIGTAGFTSMLAVMALQREEVDRNGEVVVTGASGGVGSLAVMLLSRSGFEVTASTGSREAHAMLKGLGAANIIDRDELGSGPARALESARWAGAVDTVGGKTLASLLARLKWHGTVAVCGNAGGAQLETTVFPFILRGVKMIGIDSNTSPRAEREAAWHALSEVLRPEDLKPIVSTIGLDEVPRACEQIVRGDVRGRIVVDLGRPD
jgi:acrylyl-CoA reductase (NADPH)